MLGGGDLNAMLGVMSHSSPGGQYIIQGGCFYIWVVEHAYNVVEANDGL